MRKRVVSVLAASAAFISVMATTTGASAEPNPPGCPKGYFCAYSGPNQTGTLVLKTAGNWTGGVAFQSAFNNGYALPGADHVDMTYDWQGLQETVCLHYNPGPGQYKGNAAPGNALVKVVWRGEC
ncbi:peptidase inhibitor family I36 protein [Streptosporangium carneum]|uniref:Peptidase inhibitor family I36 n=1 Tax=Streptosporangium carneum TaxID=47481 RepID=A0A9W6I341_9ACTN|nr:peptidase inhibitor family I36 protein [Streptosporangium carneum]GLK10394.1 hypothetical protein GCM10017600_38000 [Streptosporangium carneum]